MAEICPACSDADCLLTHGAPCISRQLDQSKEENGRLRRELANALSIANSRTYCLDGPEVLKERVGELGKTLKHAHELNHWAGDEIVRLQGELAEARGIGELEREVANASVAAYHAALECVDQEADLYRVKRRDAVRRLIAARAATGEPKETT